MNIEDLNIEKEIIPFFDISLNLYSYTVLQTFFTDLPKDRGEVLKRQEIIKAFLVNLTVIRNIYSYKRDIEECYSFCKDLKRSYENLNDPQLRIRLFLSRKTTDILYSKSSQTIIVFSRIYENYLKDIHITAFPEDFRNRIIMMRNTLSLFSKYGNSLRTNSFTTKKMAECIRLLFLEEKENRLHIFWNNFFLFEAYFSIASITRKYELTLPTFIDKGLHLTDFYHPLLKSPVKNSISLSQNVLLLTGPNMSGKSTFLKSISLCIYLARLGLPVPAKECQVVFVDDINVHINSRDSLQTGYSHFMTEVQNLKQSILAAEKGQRIFSVFDELFKGTNIDDALNILTITLKGLGKFPASYFLLSTHLYQLKQLHLDQPDHIGFFFIDSSVENGLPKFSFVVKEGWSDVKFGTLLFEREGLLHLLAP